MDETQSTEILVSKLKERWLKLFSLSGLKGVGRYSSTISDWWDYLESHYTESTRHYHTLHHVNSLLELMDCHVGKLTCPRAVAFAIFFHDVIYNPKADDNEEKSGAAFQSFSSQHLTEEQSLSEDVYEWILMTKDHQTPEHAVTERFGSDDKHYFLDFDMQVLGRPSEQYQDYASRIRQEYTHFLETDYRLGRAKVLTEFLERPRIYSTELFHRQYEDQARLNITEEINRLETG